MILLEKALFSLLNEVTLKVYMPNARSANDRQFGKFVVSDTQHKQFMISDGKELIKGLN